jgi:iron complex transport system ATP-binding protein
MLQVKNLQCGYGKKFHLSGISFDTLKGSFTGIIGPNGSGKTTLFRGITGELEVEKGSILLDGKDVTRFGHKEKARDLAIVTQDVEKAAIPVEDYVLMGRMPYRKPLQFFETDEDHQIAEKYLRLTDVYHLKDKFLYELSGGEQQLVSIARALTQEPKLLLLDEPTSHLDITHQVQILNLIQRLSHELGVTVLMIIHDLNLASEYCDYLVMLDSGKIHGKGTPEEVINYKVIEEVYKTVVITQQNPLSKRPAVFLVSEKILKNVGETKK